VNSVGRRVFAEPVRLGKPLSGRERQVLELVARGDTNSEIARQLGITYSTVAKHLKVIYDKLGVNNRVKAALWAWRGGDV
jgi:DNA-binding NarL/FixJ family response regulator